MSKAPSKQLGSILNRIPPATASTREEGSPPSSPSLSYGQRTRAETGLPEAGAAELTSPPSLAPPQPQPADEQEVPLQVLVPLRVRIQLDRMHAETRKPLRRLVLESLMAFGLDVTEDDLAGKRGQKKAARA